MSSFTTIDSFTPLWLQILAVGIWVSLILLSAGGISRFTKSNSEIVRKVVHIGTGNVILLAWWFNIPASIGIAASILASLLTLLSYRFPLLPGINSVGRKSLGTFFYSISIGILIAYFWYLKQQYYAVLGILIMAWGDGLAALIGQRFGKHKYYVLGGQKSIEGSLTMTVVSFIISILILLNVQGNTWESYLVSVIIALVATGLEAISFLGIDNLTVPLGSAALAFLLNQFVIN
ncbi:MAG: diacylglycerol/polyprenol kinase family protein [Cyanobacteria bacterium P01_D01_bin.50]